MLRRTLALSFVFVLVLAGVALAGQATLGQRVLDQGMWQSSRSPLDSYRMADPMGDIYHPAGSPGFTDGNIDLTSIEMYGWAVELGEVLDDTPPQTPFIGGQSTQGAVSEIKIDGPEENEAWTFSLGSPYVIAEFELALDVRYDDELYCEYPLGWWNPTHEAFQGIAGDLFNGNNYVTVARTGAGVPGGFDVVGLEFMEGQWLETQPFGYGAASGNRVMYAIPAEHFGPAGDQFRTRSFSFLRGGDVAADPIDFNFGAFCSEGGQSFDPSIGGVDILMAPVDLGMLPIDVVGPVEASPSPTTTAAPTTTATPTTIDDTPVTSVAPEPTDGGGGIDPALIALIVGGIGAAAWAVTRARAAQDDAKRPPGFSVRLDLDTGASATFADVAGLPFEHTPIEYRDGLDKSMSSMKQPGVPKYANIALKRGILGDGHIMFHEWREGSELGSGSLALFVDEQKGIEWTWDRSRIMKVDGPGLKSTGNEVAMETLELRIENPRFE